MRDIYPRDESGFFHLTSSGWVRQDTEPFPAGRQETWKYKSHIPAEDAKEQVSLTRIWPARGAHNSGLLARFGMPVLPSVERNVILECQA